MRIPPREGNGRLQQGQQGEAVLPAPGASKGPEDWQRALERAVEQANGRVMTGEADELERLQLAQERDIWSVIVRFSVAWEAAGMPAGKRSGGSRPRGRRRLFGHHQPARTTIAVIDGFGTATHRADGGVLRIPRYLVLREGLAPIFTYAPHYSGDHQAHLVLGRDQGLSELAHQMTADQVMDALATWCVVNGAKVELPAAVAPVPGGTLEA